MAVGVEEQGQEELALKQQCAGHMSAFKLDDKNEKAIEALSDFLFLLSHTDNNAILIRFINKFLNLKPSDGNDITTFKTLYAIIPLENRYVFLSMLDQCYSDKTVFGTASTTQNNMSYLPDALLAFADTNRQMAFKTKWQSRGMMLGGVTFGMEVVMLSLERVAWSNDAVDPAVILALIFAGFLVFGYPMGRFFKSAHIEALEKQNKENYFETHYGESTGKSQLLLFTDRMRHRPGYAIAAFGVLAEGLLVFRGILSGTGFVADMCTWAAKGGEYENKIPGTYFMHEFPVLGGIVCTLSVLFALAVTYSLMSGHFALDGKECCERETEEAKRKGARVCC